MKNDAPAHDTTPSRPDGLPGYVAAGTVALALLAARYLGPHLLTNERVYLARGRRLLDPGFLERDWTLAGPDAGPSFTILFDSLMAGLWAVLPDAVTVAWTGRLLAWIVVVAAMARLARTLGVRWFFFLLGFVAFVALGQGYAASEWILGGVEQKCFAYAALLAALDAAVRRRAVWAGALVGVAISFHVLVGGWGALALCAALFFERGVRPGRALAGYAIAAAVLGLPALVLAVRFLGTGPDADPADVAALVVHFRNPHHLDPDAFLTLERGLAVAGLLGGALWGASSTAARQAPVLVRFLLAVAAVYGAGLLAHAGGSLWLLKFYPFRVGDVLFPWFFWLLVPQAIWKTIRASGDRRSGVGLALALSAALIGAAVIYSQRDRALRRHLPRLEEQLARLVGTRPERGDGFGEAGGWIRSATGRDAVFAVNPCLADFWLEAERAMVVNFKSAPVNARIVEWHARLTALNAGNDFAGRGFEVCKELQGRFEALSPAQLEGIRARYGADYYLVRSERPALRGQLVFSDGDWWVYALERKP